MVIDSDGPIALPSPPPPRPAARRAAIDAALQKFDGIEATPAERDARKRPSRILWPTMHRRPAGALMTAALIAVVFIPAVQIALRDRSPGVVRQTSEPNIIQPSQDAVCEGANCAGQTRSASETPQARPAEEVVAAAPPLPAQPSVSPPAVAEGRREVLSTESDQKAALDALAPVVAAAPPPPPPRPSSPETIGAENIAVTGSRIPAANLSKQGVARAAERAAEPAGPMVMIDRSGEFLSRLQTGLRSNDRRAVIELIGFPLRVNLNGQTRTYRASRDVERDFDRIFTPQLRLAVLNQRPEALISRDRGTTLSNGRLRFGPSCSNKSCSSDGLIRIREVTP